MQTLTLPDNLVMPPEGAPEAEAIQLARIDERTRHISEKLDSFMKDARYRYVTRDEFESVKHAHQHRVTRDEFEPVKRVVYGMVGVVLLGVIGALLTLLLN
jgi:hypothetical protein